MDWMIPAQIVECGSSFLSLLIQMLIPLETPHRDTQRRCFTSNLGIPYHSQHESNHYAMIDLRVEEQKGSL